MSEGRKKRLQHCESWVYRLAATYCGHLSLNGLVILRRFQVVGGFWTQRSGNGIFGFFCGPAGEPEG